MITRRMLIASCLSSALVVSGRAARAASAQPLADELIALPGKKPLIKRTFRPPNYETSLADLRQPFTANETFYVRYHLPRIPEIDSSAWTLRVGGASARRTLELSMDELQRHFERVSIVAVNQCSGYRRGLFQPRAPGVQWGHGAIGNAVWTGVRLRDVLRRAGVLSTALEAVFYGADAGLLPATPAFVKSLPIDRALDEDTLIAFEMNGQALPHWNGAPARLVAPGWTATYWIKHLIDIRVEPAAFDGFWMKSAYRLPNGLFSGARFASQETAETAPITDIQVNSLVTSHVPGERIDRGKPAELAGWAWDAGSGVAQVEISADRGRTWRPAALGEDLGRYAWREFRAPLDASRAGRLELMVRATSRSGRSQPQTPTPNPSGYHHNAIQTLALEVV